VSDGRETWTPTAALLYVGSMIVALFVHFSALRSADKSAVDAALAAVTESNEKDAGRYAIDKAGANEWRGAMNDRERDFMSRREFRTSLTALVAVLGLALAVVLAIAGS
jgi:hypothetical protein